ncbi:hypothetical protein [Clostridium minihomine]|uniref:hypothetical protein n=1 Tax=Clostridium minihomine TaxID=2045012 RepID=UPI000C771FF3|nr:hypothetical protein [Clostridium minihomine]
MKKVKRFLSLVLSISVLITVLCSNSVSAANGYEEYFTAESVPSTRMVQDSTFTYKLTPKNAKDVLTLESQDPKIVQVVSNIKKGNSYYSTIKAVGEMGQICQMYVQVKSKDSVAHPAINYIIIKESTQAEAKRQATLREQESYEPPNDNYLSIVNNPNPSDQEGRGDEMYGVSVDISINGVTSLLPKELTIPKDSTVKLFFNTVYDKRNGIIPSWMSQPPGVEFSNPDVITYSRSNTEVITYEHNPKGTKKTKEEIGTFLGNSIRAVEITASGEVGESTDIITATMGSLSAKTFKLIIGEKNSQPQGKGIKLVQPEKRPHVKGLYGITEIGSYDVYDMKNVGVLTPLKTPYDPSRTFSQQERALSENLNGCWVGENNSITYRGTSMTGFITNSGFFVQKDGKFGLKIYHWRDFKKEGRSEHNDFYNSMLNAFCFLSNDKKTGEALWKWLDDTYTNGGNIDTNDYGFVDDPGGTDGNWTVTYKRSGVKVNIVADETSISLYFTPKQ